ncbi:MAG: PAS domain-containing sensor histidine kinase [Deltaproteobacteria bacterium]|nr:PAS domain-containing sensor histidine kinase [Deltaproteobacteria bacterium]
MSRPEDPRPLPPDELAPLETVRRQHRLLVGAGPLVEAYEAVPGGILILNRERRIVFANRAFCSFVAVPDGAALLGMRPGEAVGCLRVSEPGCRCGMTEHCRACGGLKAILESHEGEPQIRECRILTAASPGSLDLRVRAVPFRFEAEEFTLFFIQDIADEKRRAALERIFFHDVLNTAGNIRSVARLLREAAGQHPTRYHSLLDQLADELLTQIQTQRELVMAEAGELPVRTESVDAPELLRRVATLYGDGRVALKLPQERVLLSTDGTLLGRVLGNMLKNAVEASDAGETIRAGVARLDGTVTLWVSNQTVLEPRAKLQIFQRSFSTKGSGRGLGTYSMKLLGERYLGGKVSFTSAEGEGTTFRVSLPSA